MGEGLLEGRYEPGASLAADAILLTSNVDVFLDRHISSLRRSWGQSPAAEVYSILTTARGAGRIPLFGPASIKFLHFAQGFRCRPAVPHLGCPRRPEPQGSVAGRRQGAWYPESYGRYCELMGRWAEQDNHGAGRIQENAGGRK